MTDRGEKAGREEFSTVPGAPQGTEKNRPIAEKLNANESSAFRW
jgi:hypothetical protein